MNQPQGLSWTQRITNRANDRRQNGRWQAALPRRSLAEAALYVSLLGVIVFLLLARPATPFYTLALVPISLAAVLHEFLGGTLVALVATAVVAALIALDPNALRRALILQEVWPILIVYLAVGPFTGWLVARERQREWERSRQLAAIGESLREVSVSLDLPRTLRLVMANAVKTLPMDAGAIFQFDSAAQTYHVAVSHNLSPDHVSQMTFDFEEGVPGWVVQQCQPLIVGDAGADARVHPHVVEDGVLSVLALPLEAREQVVGVLNLYSKTRRYAFNRDALRLAQVFADQAAVFIENARLVAELRQAAAELEARVARRTRQLQAKQAQVFRAEKMAAVGRLAASVAHEVNNPLQAIALHLALLAEDGLPETSHDQVTIVQQELARIADIVQRLLDFQRPKHGRLSRQHITTLLDEVLALAGKQMEQAGVTAVCRCQPDLPELEVAGDQLKQVFLNLALNGVEAMPDGGELLIQAGQENGRVIISFTDAGVGMSAEVLAQVFEPFFSTKHDGSGLGLAVSHEIVTRHGGDLTAVSQPGAGATFTVSLPISQTA